MGRRVERLMAGGVGVFVVVRFEHFFIYFSRSRGLSAIEMCTLQTQCAISRPFGASVERSERLADLLSSLLRMVGCIKVRALEIAHALCIYGCGVFWVSGRGWNEYALR